MLRRFWWFVTTIWPFQKAENPPNQKKPLKGILTLINQAKLSGVNLLTPEDSPQNKAGPHHGPSRFGRTPRMCPWTLSLTACRCHRSPRRSHPPGPGAWNLERFTTFATKNQTHTHTYLMPTRDVTCSQPFSIIPQNHPLSRSPYIANSVHVQAMMDITPNAGWKTVSVRYFFLFGTSTFKPRNNIEKQWNDNDSAAALCAGL